MSQPRKVEENRYTVQGVNQKGKKIRIIRQILPNALKVIHKMQEDKYTSVVCNKEASVTTLILDALSSHYKCSRNQAWTKLNVMTNILNESGVVMIKKSDLTDANILLGKYKNNE